MHISKMKEKKKVNIRYTWLDQDDAYIHEKDRSREEILKWVEYNIFGLFFFVCVYMSIL